MWYCFLPSLWLRHRSWWIIEYSQSWSLCSPTALSEICWYAMFSYSWFQSRWQSFCQGLVFLNYSAFKETLQKYLRPYEIIIQPGTLSFTLYLPESICSVHPVFYVSILKLAMFNTFSKRIQLVHAPVIIDGEPEYEILWIVDSKIDY